MAMFDWDPTWETGNARIDGQHRELLAQMERLFNAVEQQRGAAETERTLLLLSGYIDTHFREEEALMEGAGYPGLPDHAAIHRDLQARVTRLVEAYLQDLNPITKEVMDFLLSWLRTHLAGEDRTMAGFLRLGVA